MNPTTKVTLEIETKRVNFCSFEIEQRIREEILFEYIHSEERAEFTRARYEVVSAEASLAVDLNVTFQRDFVSPSADATEVAATAFYGKEQARLELEENDLYEVIGVNVVKVVTD